MNQRPLPQTVRARQAEIKWRYERGKPSKPQYIRAVRRRQVLALLSHRHGQTLPDDDYGRDALRLLFGLGLDGMQAQALAPWVAGKVDDLAEAERDNWHAWRRGEIGSMIGRRLHITAAEKIGLRLAHLGCIDEAADAEVAEHMAKRARERDRLKKRGTRSRHRRPDRDINEPWDLHGMHRYERAMALACRPLADGEWWSVSQLCDYAADAPLGAFGALRGQSLARAVRRALRQLECLKLILTKTEITPNRLDAIFARLIPQVEVTDEATAEDEDISAASG